MNVTCRGSSLSHRTNEPPCGKQARRRRRMDPRDLLRPGFRGLPGLFGSVATAADRNAHPVGESHERVASLTELDCSSASIPARPIPGPDEERRPARRFEEDAIVGYSQRPFGSRAVGAVSRTYHGQRAPAIRAD